MTGVNKWVSFAKWQQGAGFVVPSHHSFLEIEPVKEFLKSINIRKTYGQECYATLFTYGVSLYSALRTEQTVIVCTYVMVNHNSSGRGYRESSYNTEDPEYTHREDDKVIYGTEEDKIINEYNAAKQLDTKCSGIMKH